jgi:hypothetical protein
MKLAVLGLGENLEAVGTVPAAPMPAPHADWVSGPGEKAG